MNSQTQGYYGQPNYPSYQLRQYNNLPTLKGRPVTSIEEARAQAIDFDGSIFYFPDLANKRIYTKQINVDGTASLNMYELKPIQTEIPIGEYITRTEFNETMSKLQELLTKPAAAATTTVKAENANLAQGF